MRPVMARNCGRPPGDEPPRGLLAAVSRWAWRWLFRLTCAAAAALALLVVLAPWLEGWAEPGSRWGRVLALFAQDATLRRTSLASAAGLVVTAYVFFLPTRSRGDSP